jgi:MFS family permease
LISNFIRQIPGNIILRWIGARNWLTICVVGWGTAQLGMGFVPTWGWLVFCRVWLGVFEVRQIFDNIPETDRSFLGWLFPGACLYHHLLV